MPGIRTRKTPFVCYLETDELLALDKHAGDNNLSRAAIVRLALRQYLNIEEV